MPSTQIYLKTLKGDFPHHTLVYQYLYDISKSFVKASFRLNILLLKTCAGFQINNICTVTLQNSFNLLFPLGNKAIKVIRKY